MICTSCGKKVHKYDAGCTRCGCVKTKTSYGDAKEKQKKPEGGKAKTFFINGTPCPKVHAKGARRGDVRDFG